ncbi:MAG: heat-shock protein [Gammaproteobacteria bacterium]|nr:heat-shock protein [Gammaproteobacteria bacterium]
MNQLFDITRYAIGFEKMMDRLEMVNYQSSNSNSYPPYDIIKVDNLNFKIEMALAGFNKKDITVEVCDGILSICSTKENTQDSSKVFRGISYKKFNRQFTLADDIEVQNAKLEDGLLSIELVKILPENKQPKIIKVK